MKRILTPVFISILLVSINLFGNENTQSETIDYDNMEKLAVEHKPHLIVAGASAYPRVIDFKRIREIADKVIITTDNSRSEKLEDMAVTSI